MRPVVQEINIYTQQGSVLRIRIEESNGGYCMSGNYTADDKTESSTVKFSGERVANCDDRFERALKNLRDCLNKKGDLIISVHNPCNTPFITAPQQQEILKRLDIGATVQLC